jgi:uncharacterized ferritin-like protein (DUF455 family)
MPANLYEAAGACLMSVDVAEKCAMASALWSEWQSGGLLRQAHAAPVVLQAGRPERPRLVKPRDLVQRRPGSREGRAALVHAVAHIEFNAINLACDAAYRFRQMPDDFYADWLKVAAEEAYHFSMLNARLGQLGFAYGDFPAHNGLWQLAVDTAADPLLRMALVPRVMEARGLDVTPGMMERCVASGDRETADILAIILRDEIGHVEAGSRWFRYLCEQRGLEPEATYFQLLEQHLGSNIRCPLHKSARREAGFSESELARLEALCDRT